MIKLAKDKTIKVLDLGCGNARFAQFLDLKLNSEQTGEYHSRFEYTGVDNSSKLLVSAQKNLKQLSVPNQLLELDLVESLTHSNLSSQFNTKFELIVMFGVWHHIPGENLRQKLLAQLSSLLNPSGLLIITAWQFAQDERFMSRQIEPARADLQTDQLENQDYLLDWRRGERAIRYCHYSDLTEMEKLVSQSPLTLKQHYYADGKSEELNLYLLLEN